MLVADPHTPLRTSLPPFLSPSSTSSISSPPPTRSRNAPPYHGGLATLFVRGTNPYLTEKVGKRIQSALECL
ncbi:hypothetical protein E2C01_079530 [Portunus trituberculatus]|uniref:Uncharacterized protein n=1 Tax=Portunus trituberculatus TaxID=210409 RepID=A0A5B7IH53_PORTR|nr:hypothetical protein [Portunus trituberculatus]